MFLSIKNTKKIAINVMYNPNLVTFAVYRGTFIQSGIDFLIDYFTVFTRTNRQTDRQIDRRRETIPALLSAAYATQV